MQMQKLKCDAGRRFGPRPNGLKDKELELFLWKLLKKENES